MIGVIQHQLSLWETTAPQKPVSEALLKDLGVPPIIHLLMSLGAALSISISGGKDSQAMLFWLVHVYKALGWSGRIEAVHCDLGVMEWDTTLDFCQQICRQAGVDLVIVQGDLLFQLENRKNKLVAEGNTKPFWPSLNARYCTRYKINQIDKDLRKFQLVIGAVGIRAQEGGKRAQKPIVAVRDITTQCILSKGEKLHHLTPQEAYQRWEELGRPGRLALDWLPLHDWRVERVWEWCGTTLAEYERRAALWRSGRHTEALEGWTAHPAYAMGNERLSCALCIAASMNDLKNGARHKPDLLRHLRGWENETGWSFQNGRSLKEVEAALESQEREGQVNLPLSKTVH
ncbi:phosphoadenosine phosphosulfate reductase family protein [Leptolyngbya sp. FACHB-541]|uniref:phosphoadenosine phosphosulfate reductase domain-containing protein n=1 Tax=Leptolyngbya sp. FACHB-541 TaxID=2692810 RepID=UPI0016889A87|nr:phosphoadenosine phosphosulfate reductase family protein [Leptolyngbya sp. FACHB-541]MBD1995390.1 phosphoadenosine phosphosulfate reductase family protein [Leptolyngbya sp. FACHB-541]